MKHLDPNMQTVLNWANEYGIPPALPPSLQDIDKRARLVNEVDGPLIQNSLLYTLTPQDKQQRLYGLVRIGRGKISEKLSDEIIISICLRLWAGCLDAAKTIAIGTKNGLNSPIQRQRIFIDIDKLCGKDGIYKAGVESAPKFKELRNEKYCFEGIPYQISSKYFTWSFK